MIRVRRVVGPTDAELRVLEDRIEWAMLAVLRRVMDEVADRMLASVPLVAHMPGKHDQRSHGRRAKGTPSFTELTGRQKDIDSARALGGAVAELDEIINNEARPAALRSRIDGMKRRGAIDAATADEWNSYVDRDDSAGLRDASARLAASQGLTPIGRAGDVVQFDRTRHQFQVSGQNPPADGRVEIIRPGHYFDRFGDRIRLSKATVDEPYD